MDRLPLRSCLPELDSRWVDLSARLRSIGAVLNEASGQTWRWIGVALNARAQLQTADALELLHGRVGSFEVSFAMTQLAWGLLDERLQPPCEHIPPQIQAAVRTRAIRLAIAAFDHCWAQTLVLSQTPLSQARASALSPPSASSVVPVGVTFEVVRPGKPLVRGTCFAPEKAWSEWLSGWHPTSRDSRQRPSSNWSLTNSEAHRTLSALHSPVSVSLGRVFLPRRVLQSLQANDLVRLRPLSSPYSAAPSSADDKDVVLRLTWGRLSANARLDNFGDLVLNTSFGQNHDLTNNPNSFESDDGYRDGEGVDETSEVGDEAPLWETASPPEHAPAPLSLPSNASSLPELTRHAPDCLVQFEVAQLSLPLQTLLTAMPGDVLRLNNSVDTARIDLKSEGKTFACGRLVVVGGDLAVLITQIGPA